MTTIANARALADLISTYDSLNGILAGAEKNRGDCIENIVCAFEQTIEQDFDGDDLIDAKTEAARLATQYYLDGIRQMRDKIGAELTAQGIELDAPRPVADAGEIEPQLEDGEASAAVDDPDAAPAQAAAE